VNFESKWNFFKVALLYIGNVSTLMSFAN